MMYIEFDDLRQSYVVAKNEIRKFVRGKRFTMYVALIAIVFALITFLPYLVGDGLSDTPGGVISSYVSSIQFLIVLAVTLFASVVIVSEFEERTALILFTRPIKKTSIFLGKVLGCLALETVMIVIFYLGMAAVTFIIAGSISGEFLISLGVAFLYLVATSGVAILISSVMKKGSICAILTFVLLLLILPIISQAIGGVVDPWFMLDQAAGAIATSIPEYVTSMNEMIQNIIDNLNLPPGMFESMMVSAPDMVKTVVTMLAWAIVSMVSAWVAFIRREF